METDTESLSPDQVRGIALKLRDIDASMNPDPEVNDRIVRAVIDAINASGHHCVTAVEEDHFDPEDFRAAMRGFLSGTKRSAADR